MLRTTLLKQKSFWAILLIATIPLLVTTLISIKIAETALEKQVVNNLSTIADQKVLNIENFIRKGRDDANLLVQAPFLLSTLKDERQILSRGSNNLSSMLKASSELAGFASIFLKRPGSNYSDIILMSIDGTILFSAADPALTGKKFQETPLNKSRLPPLFKDVVTLMQTQVSDFSHLENRKNPEAFIVSPILDKQVPVGVLALQMSNESITEVVNNLENLGGTGETLVGSIVNNRIIPEVPLRFTNIEGFIAQSQKVNNNLMAAFDDATQGGKGQGSMTDYRGNTVIGVWRYVPSFGWGMLVKMDSSEIYAPIYRMISNIILLGSVALLLAILIATFISMRLQKAENSLKAALEELKIAVEEAKSANEVKSQFLANMSHELRTPLNAIIGYTEMLQEDATDMQLPGFEKDLARIHGSAKHLLSLINDILDFAKIEAGRIEMYLEDIKVHTLVNGLNDLIKPLLDKNQNTFILDCEPEIGMIHTDITRLSQSLLNLLSNATKFTEKGTIRLSVLRDRSSDKDWYRFIVSDNGIGMNTDQLARLFQPFSQADASITRKYGGTGLGLNISKKFCQMLGGDISVSSEEGKGSTFIIHLPEKSVHGIEKAEIVPPASLAISSMQAVDKAQESDTTKAKTHTILIVDDDRDIHKDLRQALEKAGFETLHAFNGEEGLKLARQYKPDLIVLDIDMPIMDGLSALSFIKNDSSIKDIPVMIISLTGNSDLNFAMKATDYLSKPINNNKLLEVIEKNLRSVHSISIMVVDDDASVRDLLGRAISKNGWKFIPMENGKQALAWLEQAPQLPSILLLDLIMPELDGFAVINAIRQNPAWSSIPIIVITSKELTEEEKALLNVEVKDLFIKGSCSRRELIQNVCGQVSKVVVQTTDSGDKHA